MQCAACVKSPEQENSQKQTVEGKQNEELLFTDYRVSVLQNDKSSADGGVTTSMELTVLNSTFKSSEYSKFYVICILPKIFFKNGKGKKKVALSSLYVKVRSWN